MHRGNRYIVVVPDAIIFKRIGRKRSIGRRRDAAFVSAVVKSKALSRSGSLGRHKERAQTARKRDRRNVRDRRMACGIARRVAFVARVTIRRRGLPCWRTSALREGRRQAQDEKGKTEETPCRRCDQLAADARGKKKREKKKEIEKKKKKIGDRDEAAHLQKGKGPELPCGDARNVLQLAYLVHRMLYAAQLRTVEYQWTIEREIRSKLE